MIRSDALTDAPPETVVLVLTTFPADGDITGLARTLIDARLAACVTAQPGLTSIYRWQDTVEVTPEQQVMVKTTRGRLDALERRLTELHPYDVPEILVTPVGGAEPYLAWVRAAVSE